MDGTREREARDVQAAVARLRQDLRDGGARLWPTNSVRDMGLVLDALAAAERERDEANLDFERRAYELADMTGLEGALARVRDDVRRSSCDGKADDMKVVIAAYDALVAEHAALVRALRALLDWLDEVPMNRYPRALYYGGHAAIEQPLAKTVPEAPAVPQEPGDD
jgi:hypothetical protein